MMMVSLKPTYMIHHVLAIILSLGVEPTEAIFMNDDTPIDDLYLDGDLVLGVLMPLYYSAPGKKI